MIFSIPNLQPLAKHYSIDLNLLKTEILKLFPKATKRKERNIKIKLKALSNLLFLHYINFAVFL